MSISCCCYGQNATMQVINPSRLAMGVIVTITGIATMVISLLIAGNILHLNAHANLALAGLGGSLAMFGGFTNATALKFDDSKACKVAVSVLPGLAAIALILGSFGLSGHIPAFQGNVGLFMAGSGVITILFTCATNLIQFPCSIIPEDK